MYVMIILITCTNCPVDDLITFLYIFSFHLRLIKHQPKLHQHNISVKTTNIFGLGSATRSLFLYDIFYLSTYYENIYNSYKM